jgi:hypothetical protein
MLPQSCTLHRLTKLQVQGFQVNKVTKPHRVVAFSAKPTDTHASGYALWHKKGKQENDTPQNWYR